MDDFMFVVRTFAVTVVIFLAMQIRVGGRSIEQHSLAFVHSSSFVESLQNVSDGAVHVVHIASHKIAGIFTHLPSVSAPATGDSREVKRRIGKRAEARKAMSHEAIVEPVRKAAAAPAEPNDEAQAQADERKTGSFRTFFDVKTVHDAEKQ